MKKALIIGATGMDGQLMTNLLINKGYKVLATYHIIMPNLIHSNLTWTKFDYTEYRDIYQFFPFDEIYNFGGVTFSPDSIRLPEYALQCNYYSVAKILEYIDRYYPETKFFQSSSSEVFGNVKDVTLNLKSQRQPHTPYAEAKHNVDMLMSYMREQGRYCYNAISFNHEYITRGEHFITRKISKYAAKVYLHMTDEKLFLGDINARRDWGYAPDFVVGFYHQMQLEEPTELLFATNQTHSVKDILELAFGFIGRRFEEHIYVKQEFIRNDDRNNIKGDYSKATELIGWQPIKKFNDMIIEMLKNDINLLKNA